MSTTELTGQSSAIPVPANFPVTWPRPEDAALLWAHLRTHAPRPATTMTCEVLRLYLEDGVEAAGRAYDVPLRIRTARINSYFYLALTADPAALGGRPDEKLDAAMAGLEARWRDELLPEIEAHLAFWDGFDLAGAAMPALLEHFDETVARELRLLEIHFLLWYPMLVAISSFQELYAELFGQTGAFDAFKLLQGFENMTVETGRALWRLSRRALAVPSVRQILEERAAAEVLSALDASPEGRAFRAELDAYLAAYGQRGEGWGVSDPSWIEDPTPVIKSLETYVGQPDRDLDAEMAAAVAERERLVAAARERLAADPPTVRERFEHLLRAAQFGNVLSEDHGFWIDFQCQYRVRKVLLELGRRLVAAGVLEGPDDVMLLTLDELRETAAAAPRLDRRPLLAARAAEMAYFGTIAPPPVLGTPPSGPPPDDAVSRALGKFFGPPPVASEEPNVLRGGAGSPGTVRGTARVIRSLADAGRLRPGDVLVAETTAPAWTPLFASAAAVVTDTGGILSHCAIVAREYGIPAVVGVGAATVAIRDGQTIEVDGDAGVVRIVG